MSVQEEIRGKLEAAFRPASLDILDESERHRHHSGWREGGETHFRVKIRAPAFAGLSRLERHRALHSALGPELLGRIHALALDIDG
jgi:BolA protein